ncbi:MAG: GNAT family N-acetyltransferase [Ferruginibacter sp.]
MIFKTLKDIPVNVLLESFNLSFSDYLVPFHLSKEQLENKMASENIRPEFSSGAFDNEKLIGFILHGYDVVNNIKTVYNGGTGVIPSQRGHKLTSKLYQFIIPLLQREDIKKVQLEVIKENTAALKVYENTGFHVERNLNCYRGKIEIKSRPTGFEIKPLTVYDWEELQNFWDWQPAWQNSATAVSNLKETNTAAGAYKNNQLVGYIIYNPVTKRIQHFAVQKDHRNKGIGRQLFEYIALQNNNELTLINIDGNAKDTNDFLAAIGLKTFITQYEMIKLL